jgi:hypothetical protein
MKQGEKHDRHENYDRAIDSEVIAQEGYSAHEGALSEARPSNYNDRGVHGCRTIPKAEVIGRK